MNKKEGVTRHMPCEICGRADGDFRLITPEGYTSHWCFRQSAENCYVNGKEFICTGSSQTHIAKYSIFMEKSEYFAKKEYEKKEWLAKKDRENPDWRKEWAKEQQRKNPNWKPQRNKNTTNTVAFSQAKPKVQYEEVDVSKIAPVDRLNEVYQCFLDCLVLEEKHKQKLLSEWGKSNVTNMLYDVWKIRSLPPLDFQRFRGTERFINTSRKQIMERLVSNVGEPLYVPGFYRAKNGSYTCSGLSGILYPVYDPCGRLIRLRVGNDYPDVKGNFEQRDGVYHHKWNNGFHEWYFTSERTADEQVEDILVYGRTVKNIILKNEIPIGKCANKYLNFTSYSAVVDEEKKKVFNALTNGAKAGSLPALYFRKNDSFSVVDATEGEKKAIVNNAFTKHPTIALPGVGTWAMLFKHDNTLGMSWLEYLISKGMHQFNLMYDADKNENARVLNAEQDFVCELSKSNIQIFIGEWNANWGKGLDDIELEGVMPKYIPYHVK